MNLLAADLLGNTRAHDLVGVARTLPPYSFFTQEPPAIEGKVDNCWLHFNLIPMEVFEYI